MNAPVESENVPLKTLVARWLLSQGVSTVLLFGILAAIFYFGKYLVVDGIPKHLQQIQDGYERLAGEHAKVRKEDRETFTNSIGELKGAIKENTEATRRLTNARERDEQRLLNQIGPPRLSPN